MQEILTRLNARNEFTIITFDEEVLLNDPIEVKITIITLNLMNYMIRNGH